MNSRVKLLNIRPKFEFPQVSMMRDKDSSEKDDNDDDHMMQRFTRVKRGAVTDPDSNLAACGGTFR